MQTIDKLKNLPRRDTENHKGTFGRVLVIAGSTGMSGAGCLAAHAAQKAGAGLITLALPKGLNYVGEQYRASVMSHPLEETDDGALSLRAVPKIAELAQRMDVCALGPGLGSEDETQEVVEILVRELEVPLVIDADGLNALQKKTKVLLERSSPTIITPHPGEMAALAGLEGARAVQKNRRGVSTSFAKEHGVITVLKGHKTLVTDGNSIYVNMTGNPGMATGGMGDVLTGIIAALAGQGMGCLAAACLGVFVHGLAGDIASEKQSMTSNSPEDVIETLPKVFLQLEKTASVINPLVFLD